MRELLEALLTWIEDRPAWLRPALYGALLVPAWAIAKGALLLLPIAIVVVFLTGEHPLRTLGLGLLIFCLAVAGAALSGLAYSCLGRRVQGMRLLGPYLAGWLSSWPYVLVVLVIIRVHAGTPLTVPFADAEWFTLGIGTLYAGGMVGWMFFRDA